jgi:hypothetical protein
MIKVTKGKGQIIETSLKGDLIEFVSDLIAIGMSLADACDGSEEVAGRFKNAFELGINEGLKAKGNEEHGKA